MPNETRLIERDKRKRPKTLLINGKILKQWGGSKLRLKAKFISLNRVIFDL